MGQLLCSSKSVTVNKVNYTVVEDIGEGAFSFVQHVSRGKEHFALKRVLVQVEEQEVMLEREVKAHRMFTHPNIMPLIDHEVVRLTAENKEGRLLFPYYRLGSVQEMIEVAQATGSSIPETQVLGIFRSLCIAVHEFHKLSPALAHRDVKPHNMLILTESTIVLMDLGSCDLANVQVTSRKQALALQEKFAQECTAAFRAPELFEVPSECLITSKSDVWSLGCVLHALCYGESPCDGSATSSLNPDIKTPAPSPYSQGLNQLIQFILKVDAFDRPSVSDIFEKIDELIS